MFGESNHNVYKGLVGSCAVVVMLSMANVGAAGKSDVADAVMRGDTAAVRIARAEGRRERASGRWGDGAPLGRLPGRLATTDLLIRPVPT